MGESAVGDGGGGAGGGGGGGGECRGRRGGRRTAAVTSAPAAWQPGLRRPVRNVGALCRSRFVPLRGELSDDLAAARGGEGTQSTSSGEGATRGPRRPTWRRYYL